MSNTPNPNETYTLDDLASWQQPEPGGAWLAVLGHPIQHSLSPSMHNAALAEMALRDPKFANWKYFKFDVPPEDFTEDALDQFRAAGFKGLNLTIPHKVKAIMFGLDLSLEVKAIGATNTIDLTGATFIAYNTDSLGLSMGIFNDLAFNLRNQSIILLGAGGAARGALTQCQLEQCQQVHVGNRNQDRLQGLIKMRESGGFADTNLHSFDLSNVNYDSLPANALVINATSVGMKEGDPSPFDLSKLNNPIGVYDMIYNPPETPLLKQAKELGIPCANGLSMLVHQGAQALSVWTRENIDPEPMFAAARKALGQH